MCVVVLIIFYQFFFRGIYVHTHEVSYGRIFEKKHFFLFLLKLRVPIHPRDGLNRNINHMATTGFCDPSRGWIGTNKWILKKHTDHFPWKYGNKIYIKKYHFQNNEMGWYGGVIKVCILLKKLQVGTFSHFWKIYRLCVFFHRKIETYVKKLRLP